MQNKPLLPSGVGEMLERGVGGQAGFSRGRRTGTGCEQWIRFS